MLYAYYGDDFTGSTDVLEQLAGNGIPAVLFLGPPSDKNLKRFHHCQAIGIAGDSRSRSPEWMSRHLPEFFRTLQSFQAPVAHYKVCSTFDSSPTHGSIGRAMEIGMEVFAPEFLPIVVGSPYLRRYVCFGNLFAAGENGIIHRIDRHPTMSRHPVTPMCESDLRKHLRLQTSMPVGLADLRALQSDAGEASLRQHLQENTKAILFDGIDQAMLAATGRILWKHALQKPLFSVGSSGLTSALVPVWQEQGLIERPASEPRVAPSEPLLVISGSCSPTTEAQLRWGLANGFHGIAVDVAKFLKDQTTADSVLEDAVTSVLAGKNTMLYTALGPPGSSGKAYGDSLGQKLGELLKQLLIRTTVSRVLLCGGDTSSHAMQQLGVYALTWMANLQTGAPLCRAHSEEPRFQNLELVLKGGQVGTKDFFSIVYRGSEGSGG